MSTSRLWRRPAYPVYLMICASDSLFFALIATVNLIYQVTVVGLNPLQLVLVGTVLEAWYFLAEIPTGVVADAVSRRRSVIIGYVLTGLGFALEGAIPHLWAVLAAQIVWGTGAAFVSGAEAAWIVDEVGQDRAASVFLRGSQVGHLGALAGIAGSVGLGLIDLRLSIVAGGLLFVALGAVLTVIMPETGFTPGGSDGRGAWRSFAGTLRAGVSMIRTRRVLTALVAVAVVGGAASEGWDRLWTPHILVDIGLPKVFGLAPVVWFGLIQAVAMLLSLGLIQVVRRQVEAHDAGWTARILPAVVAGSVAAMLTFALAPTFGVALLAFWVAVALRTSAGPLWAAWMNSHIDSDVRATVLSMAGQADSLGQIGAGPVVGVVANGVSISAGIVLSGLLLTPAIALLTRAGRRQAAGELPDHEAHDPASAVSL